MNCSARCCFFCLDRKSTIRLLTCSYGTVAAAFLSVTLTTWYPNSVVTMPLISPGLSEKAA